MDIDLPAILLWVVGVLGIIWVIDKGFFEKSRLAKDQDALDPKPVEYAKAFFPVLFLVLFIIISIKLFKIFINKYIFKKKSKISNYKISLLIAFFVTLWPIVPSGNFFNNWLNILYFFPLGFYLEKIKYPN